MGLFQRQDKTNPTAALYTFGQQKSVVIVGLGNIGAKYHRTRHNIGFACIDAFADKMEFPGWQEKKDLKCYMTANTLGQTRVILIKPTTYMNLSGEAVQAVCQFYKVAPNEVVVVHDELDIPFGQIRTRIGGSAAGHNGVKSIIQHLGEDFGRVRIGIGADTRLDSADFVLAKFSKDEERQLSYLLNESVSLLTEFVYSGNLLHETRNFIV